MSRQAGIPNKNKQALLNILQLSYPDYHPVLEMAHIAHDESNDIQLRASMHKEVAQYITPKLKAIEIKSDVSGSITLGWRSEDK